jgi:hypothetical protein
VGAPIPNRRCPEQAHQHQRRQLVYIGKAIWQRASGAPKQVSRRCQAGAEHVPRQQAAETRRCQVARRCAGRQAGAHRRGEERRQPPDEVNGLRNYVVASYGRSLGIALDAR